MALLAWLVVLLCAAAPAAAAAPIRLSPASGQAGARAALRARGLPPDSMLELRVGRGPVRLLRADHAGRVRARPEMSHGDGERVRIALQDAEHRRAVLHYRVRSRWSEVSTVSAGDWRGRVVQVTADLRRGKLAATVNLGGLASDAAVSVVYAHRRVARGVADGTGFARIPVTLAQDAPGRALTVRTRSARFVVKLPTPAATLVAVGDIACEPPYRTRKNFCRHAEVARLADRLNPDAIAIAGDIQYRSATMDEFRNSFDPTWGWLKMPMRPVPGNHEYRTQDAAGYFEYFQSQSGWLPPLWYAYNLGRWQLLALNSNCEPGRVDCSEGSVQETWLRETLAAEPHRCTLAYWHHPRYSSGFHGSDPRTNPFWRDLDEAGAELVISGHDHHYERFAPQDETGQRDESGVRQFVVGTGGSAFSVVHRDRAPHSVYAQNRQFGVLLLHLFSDSYMWRFVALNGKVLDRGLGGCE